jgi:mannose-6-phosphate isomerase
LKLNYPIKFTPILKERIWGGDKLAKLYGKKESNKPIGESWEISTVPGNISVVENGPLEGQNLQDLIKTYKAELLGEEVYEKYGETFPLLVKFIEANTDLSVQLHPDNQLAKERHQSFGKEEMWYIMQTEKNSRLLFGFNKQLTKESYKAYVESGKLEEVLHQEKVKKGAVYYIPPGRVHAIGAGIVLAEIQQSSDITYRIYDWNRTDTEGKSRELHTDLALDAIDFSNVDDYQTHYRVEKEMFRNILSASYFSVKILKITTKKQILTTSKDSFIIYMCVKGNGYINVELMQVPIKEGETILIPAGLRKYSISPERTMKLLYIKAK